LVEGGVVSDLKERSEVEIWGLGEID
jgi:hypothetical protein